MFAAIDKEEEMKRQGPDVRFGRKHNVLGAENVAIGGDAHVAMYGISARKPIEKKMSANQAAKEVRKKLRLYFKNLANAFRAADADKSGSISPREFRVMVCNKCEYYVGYLILKCTSAPSVFLHGYINAILMLTAHQTWDNSFRLWV